MGTLDNSTMGQSWLNWNGKVTDLKLARVLLLCIVIVIYTGEIKVYSSNCLVDTQGPGFSVVIRTLSLYFRYIPYGGPLYGIRKPQVELELLMTGRPDACCRSQQHC